MRLLLLLVLLLAAPALAAKPAPLPPLPPLVVDAAAPIVTITIDGVPLRLRVDPGGTRHVQINASAARRLGLGNSARLVAGKPADSGHSDTQIGMVSARESTGNAIGHYADRDLPLVLAWSDRDHVDGADGLIGPGFLPHDEIRLVRRAASAADRTTRLAMHWDDERGLLGTVPVGDHVIDVQISPAAAQTIATAAAAAWLVAAQGGHVDGPVRDAVIAQGVARPVRDIVLDRPVTIAGITLARVATRLFDWSGKTSLPADAAAGDEMVVRAKFDAQREWPKLAIGNDHLGACAEITWHRLPLAIELTCPAA
ncbi:MAG: hypothetical protein H7268_01650 [Sandarakinorhabdus sp.]|nr:hypothetical protein [Sandarakinorhabdus sp.]